MEVLERQDLPEILRLIEGTAERLFLRGDRHVLGTKMVAVVGSRKASKRGLEATKRLVNSLVGQGYTIVSGLAYGIDTEAHRACLEVGGKTVAVLAHGLDMVYPEANLRLAEEIIETHGALISEYEAHVRPEKEFFKERNRIVVGLSQAVFVVEAQLRSGTLVSANHAAEMGREVFAVPGSPGCDLLIREGAKKLDI